MKKYNHKKIERKWQKSWEKSDLYKAVDNDSKPKYYCLVEFPYPSGDGLHVGHCRSFSAIDIIARKKRMEGFNVLFPMGWDAFGLPTENYAIKTGKQPEKVTKDNVKTFVKQCKSIGFSFDWLREVNTTDPEYFKWTQWIFLQLYKRGLAYKKKMPINWCPSCKIGLANEEVVDEKCERCGAKAEKKELEQWMMRITAYADRLIKDLDTVDYLEKIKTQQINWIGKSEGAEISFPVDSPRIYSGELPMDHGIHSVEFPSETEPRMNSGCSHPDDKKHPDDAENSRRNYFLNFSVKYNGAIFSDDNENEIKALVEIFQRIFKEKGYKVPILVVMPEHVHLILDLPIDAKIQEVIKNIKGASARYFFHKFPGWQVKLKGNLWTPGYNFEEIAASEDLERVMRYIKNNPKKAGLSDKNRFLSADDVVCDAVSVDGHGIHSTASAESIRIFTTRIDTIFSGTFLILSPEHEFISANKSRIENWKDVEKYIANAKDATDIDRTNAQKEITGIELKGITAINPATGKKMSVWAADFVLAHYGTGAVFADAHDLRDFKMAKKYGIPLQTSVEAEDKELNEKVKKLEECYEGEGVLYNSMQFNGLKSAEARPKIISWLQEKGLASPKVTYHLRDWVFSRQHYWGEPIPMVWCEHCKEKIEKSAMQINFRNQKTWTQLVNGRKTIETRALNPEESASAKASVDRPDRYFGNVKEGDYILANNKVTGEQKYFQVKKTWKFKNLEELFENPDLLPKISPEEKEFRLENWKNGYAKLAPDYLEKIEKNGMIAWEVEAVIPGWMPLPDSELPLKLPKVKNYQPTGTGESPLSSINSWVNTTCPVCGGKGKRETDTMPNWAGSSWYFLRYIDPKNKKSLADFDKLKYWLPVDLYNGGMEHVTLHLLYSRFWHKFLYDIGSAPTLEPYMKRIAHGMILASDNQKMSKSRGNVINPTDIVEEYGADVLRMYEMFIGPYDQAVAWDVNGVKGVRRFIERVYNFSNFVDIDKPEIVSELQKLIVKATNDIESRHFNTVVSSFMIFMNSIQESGCTKATFKQFLILLSPFAPHLSEELWSMADVDGSIFNEQWPKADPDLIKNEEIEIAVQVNGKVRDKLSVNADISEEEIKKMALASEKVRKFLNNAEPKKIIYIKGKIISIVA